MAAERALPPAVWDLYKRQPGIVLGFHGCDAITAEAVFAGEPLNPSSNPWDWLGAGTYFWEANPARAMQFAVDSKNDPLITRGKIKNPAVLGAVIDLGYCFNLVDSMALAELAEAHKAVSRAWKLTGQKKPRNVGHDRRARFLDRAVIEFMHVLRQERGMPAYDSLRSPFWEGGRLYPGAGFAKRAHIQIAVRNPGCIKGYFRPILSQATYASPPHAT